MVVCGLGGSAHAAAYLSDTPLLSTASLGPSTAFSLSHATRGRQQPASLPGGHVGPGWQHNWQAWLEDIPAAPGKDVQIFARDGGYLVYAGYSAANGGFALESSTQARLVLASANPVQYQRILPDGTTEMYAQAEALANGKRRIRLSAITDPHGHSVRLAYDTQERLSSLTDAAGRITRFSYDSAAQPQSITRVTDFAGREAQFSYDAQGRLQSITDVIGLTSQMAYSAAGGISSVTTPYGTTQIVTGQDGYRKWSQITDPLGHTERQEMMHGAPGLPFSLGADQIPSVPNAPAVFNRYMSSRNSFYWNKTTMSAMGGKLDYTRAYIRHWHHAARDQTALANTLEAEKSPLENYIWYFYSGQSSTGFQSPTSNNPIAFARKLPDGSSQIHRISYNPRGRVSSQTDPAGRITRYEYAANGVDRVAAHQVAGSRQEAIGNWTFDAKHLPLTVTDAAGQTTQLSYSALGQVARITDALGNVTRYDYDAQGQLIRVINPNGQVQQSYAWDSQGRMASQTDSEGYTLRFSHDALNRQTAITYPDGSSERMQYDRLDLVAHTDRMGRTTSYRWDANRRLASQTDPSGITVRYEYDPDGRLVALIDGKGQTTRWQRDIQGRVIRKTYPGGDVQTTTWDRAGRVSSQSDSMGHVRTFAWSMDDQPLGWQYSGGLYADAGTVKIQYDSLYPRMTSSQNPVSTTSYQYHGAGVLGTGQLASRNVQYHLGNGISTRHEIAYVYDALGRITTRTLDGQYSSRYVYDALGRLQSEQNLLGTFVTSYLGQTSQPTGQALQGQPWRVSYDWETNAKDRALSKISFGGNARQSKHLDATPPLGNIVVAQEPLPPLWIANPAPWEGQLNYAFDALGQLVRSQQGSDHHHFKYDLSGRLIQDLRTPHKHTQGSYGYDEAGNLVLLADASGFSNFTHDSRNAIVLQDGNTPQRWVVDLAGQTREDALNYYGWDSAGQLLGVLNKRSGSRTDFERDPQGRLIGSVSGTQQYAYLWCDEYTPCARVNAYGQIDALYYGQGEVSAAVPYRRYYARDHLGSVRAVTDAQGQVVGRQDYSPYGSVVAQSGLMPSVGYAGMWQHHDSGINLTLYRGYQPAAGRWLSRDPIGEGGGLNLFAYVSGNPLKWIDPHGLKRYPNDFMGPLPSDGYFESQMTKTRCGLVPPSPPGVDIYGNMRVAKNSANPLWFRSMVKNKGPWDFKQQGSVYQDFGNFHFGATGASFGFYQNILLQEAGRAQQAAGTSRPEWGYPPNSRWDIYGGKSPYGDDPDDQAQIVDGISFCRCMGY
ncbi:RHS repeat-associated core domain-containing protein [Ottowia sp. VDI28]|uniref:RHS repeat-associated core domain-containing protein n=1 Tax=Ottowia sp. VDI28 TaxID=3133968 RepID=UPI003C2BAD13